MSRLPRRCAMKLAASKSRKRTSKSPRSDTALALNESVSMPAPARRYCNCAPSTSGGSWPRCSLDATASLAKVLLSAAPLPIKAEASKSSSMMRPESRKQRCRSAYFSVLYCRKFRPFLPVTKMLRSPSGRRCRPVVVGFLLRQKAPRARSIDARRGSRF